LYIETYKKIKGGIRMFDVAIIGCGVVGAATAFMLSQRECSVVVLEKENDVATGATRANSAIIHAGYDPEPGTKMARLNVRGVELAQKLCKELDVPYIQNGSLVLAFDEADDKTVEKLYHRGVENGVPGLEIISGDEARKREPNLSKQVTSALWAPSAGIINPWEYALAMIETAVRNGVELRRECAVTGLEKTENGWKIDTTKGTVEARFVINAAGVHSEEIHNMAAAPAFKIIPNRGEYYLMDKSDGGRANSVLFQCPSASGKGVLVSPTVGGNLIVGPSADNAEDGDCVGTTAKGLAFVREKAMKTMPDLTYRGAIRNFAGMRANSDQADFFVQVSAPGFVDLACIKSPGLSAAPAIAEEAVVLLEGEGLALPPKAECITTRRRVIFNELSQEEKAKIIAEDPLYGRVICRCETITEGEIVHSLHCPVPPVSIDGVKRRAGAGLGRCQGGFCGPRVAEIIARELGIPMTEMLKDTAGTNILVSETKQKNK
jgi:glycerol-3-phosphate dehydrogenase